MTETKEKPRTDNRIKYPFCDAKIGDINVLTFDKRKDCVKVRCAAHMNAYNRGWQFTTKIRETDAGLFDLTVKRVR